MKTFSSLDDLAASVGQPIVTDWWTVTQAQINQFADATGDHQWIHVDVERARLGPFGTTIAHGYLTLSLLAGFFDRATKVEGVRMGINYGLNKVRFTSPVPSGSRLRAQLVLQGTEPIEGGVQASWKCTVEREGSDKPACVAESLARYYV